MKYDKSTIKYIVENMARELAILKEYVGDDGNTQPRVVVPAIAIERPQKQEKPRRTVPNVRLEIPVGTRASLGELARASGKSMGEIVRRILGVEIKKHDPATPPVSYTNGAKMVFTSIRMPQKMKETLCHHARAMGMSIGGYAGRLVYQSLNPLGA